MGGISRKVSREVDRRACDELGIPSLSLMENAGAGAARIALELLGEAGGEVLCVAGRGGNGGDALVVARHLAVAARPVRIVLAGEPQGDAAVQRAICGAMGLRVESAWDLDPADAALIVDGLYGTGLTREICGADATLVHAMNSAGVPILALDLPSGLDCDTGMPLGPCVRACVTATFVAPKLGFAEPASREFTGDVRVVPIGAPLPPESAAR